MGLKRQYQIRMKQRQKRKAKRKHLLAKKLSCDEYLYGKYYIKLGAPSQ